LTGELTAQPVLDIIVGFGDKHLVGVTTSRAPGVGGPGSNEVFRDSWVATANHPIWVEGSGWTDAQELKIGDFTVGANGGLRIVSTVTDYGWMAGQTVYNLSVANIHTFVVGNAHGGALVHNCNVIHPSLVRFSQDSAKRSFADGRSVDAMVQGLKSGAIKPNSVRPVRLVNRNGVLYSLDNRRLGAFQEAGKMMPYRMATAREIRRAEKIGRFSTKNGGVSIRWRR
jgi:hypothetical protein